MKHHSHRYKTIELIKPVNDDDKALIVRTCECGSRKPFQYGSLEEMDEIYKSISKDSVLPETRTL